MEVRKNFYISEYHHLTVKAIAEQANKSIKEILSEAINDTVDYLSNVKNLNDYCMKTGKYHSAHVGKIVRRGLFVDIFDRSGNEGRKTYYISEEHDRMLKLMALLIDSDSSGVLNGCIVRLSQKYSKIGYEIPQEHDEWQELAPV